MIDSPRNKAILSLALVLAVTFFSFWPSLKNGFLIHWDDDEYLYQNTSIRQLDWPHVRDLFQSRFQTTYIPLTMLTFAVEYHFFGLDPLVYHLDNLLLHLIVTGLIFWFALRCRFSLRAALVTALLFGIHPIHVESVAWVTERKDVLYAFFYMLALHEYWRWCHTRKKTAYMLSIFFGLLSILAKPMALSLPLVMFACDWWWKRPINRNTVLEKIPYFAYIIPLAWLTWAPNAAYVTPHGGQGILVWMWTLAFYIRQLFYPRNLLALYSLPQPVDWSNPVYPIATMIVVIFFGSLIIGRKNRFYVFGCLFFFLSIFFLLRFEYLNKDVVNFAADRYMYLPSLGLIMLIGFYADRVLTAFKENKILSMVLLVSLIAACGALSVKTWNQCRLWGNEIALWSRVIEHQPVSEAYDNLGIVYGQKGQYNLAIEQFNLGLRLNPQRTARLLNNRGVALLRLGQFGLALKDFDRSLELEPSELYFRMSRGDLYRLTSQNELALVDYSKAVQISPKFVPAYIYRAVIHHRLKQDDLALLDYNKILELDPRNTQAYYNKAVIYLQQNLYNLAQQNLDQVIRINPQYPNIQALIGKIQKMREKPLSSDN